MSPEAIPGRRCGLDTVELARVERMVLEKSLEELAGFFSARELQDAGNGAGRVATPMPEVEIERFGSMPEARYAAAISRVWAARSLGSCRTVMACRSTTQ